MELQQSSDGEWQTCESACNGEAFGPGSPHDDVDSNCSTPYVSAPSSPCRGISGGYFFSAPASPVHFVLSSFPRACADEGRTAVSDFSISGSEEFEFSARCSGAGGGAAAAGSMTSADELFLNGQIRPMKLSSHLQRSHTLAPLLDLDAEEEEVAIRDRDPTMRSRSLHRRTRSMSPERNAPFPWHVEVEEEEERRSRVPAAGDGGEGKDGDVEIEPHLKQSETTVTPSVSASSSRSSSTSSSRSSKRWVFLKDLLHRSKSEGRENAKERVWNASPFSSSKDKSFSLFFRDRSKGSTTNLTPASPPSSTTNAAVASSPAGGAIDAASSAPSKAANRGGKRRVPAPSPHERHYTANRAQAEEMRRKTFLPYRQGVLGCLGFSSRSYGAMNGFTRTLNPVSSR